VDRRFNCLLEISDGGEQALDIVVELSEPTIAVEAQHAAHESGVMVVIDMVGTIAPAVAHFPPCERISASTSSAPIP